MHQVKNLLIVFSRLLFNGNICRISASCALFPQPSLFFQSGTASKERKCRIGNEAPAAFNQRRKQQFLMNIRNHLQQFQDFRSTRPSHVTEASPLSLVGDDTVAEEAVEPNLHARVHPGGMTAAGAGWGDGLEAQVARCCWRNEPIDLR